MNVLSLCDGMSCGQIALKELDYVVDNYYASEIDKKAIQVTQDNFPNTVQLGDVTKISEDVLRSFPKIDLVIFGSPCRSLSNATAGREKYNNGLEGVSGLFYYCNNILQWIKENNNPNVLFMVENVDCNKSEDLEKMSKCLGVDPVLINCASFAAQIRKRNYWTNIPLDEIPEENCLVIEDILDKDVPEKYFYKESFSITDENRSACGILDIKGHDIIRRISNRKMKCPALTACRGGNHQKKIIDGGRCRKLTPNEYRKLQTIPEWYKMNVSDSAIYNMCGDGWNIETIKFIFKNIK